MLAKIISQVKRTKRRHDFVATSPYGALDRHGLDHDGANELRAQGWMFTTELRMNRRSKAPPKRNLDGASSRIQLGQVKDVSSSHGKPTTVTGVSEFAMVEEPPVLSITFRMPPDPAVLRKIVSRSFMLDGARVVGTSNAFAA